MNLFSRRQRSAARVQGPSKAVSAATLPASLERMLPDPDESRRIARLEAWSFHSALLPEPASRQISVYLPEAYFSDPERPFPVLYLHDGQNLFDPHTSYLPGRTWHAGETADRMAASGVCESIILVGIANTGLRRMAEYTPTKDFRLGGGEGPTYGQMLVHELKPLIDKNYRTRTGCMDTGVGGSSLGGLISLYLGLEYGQVFGKLAVLSPSLWWDHRAILTRIEQARLHPDFKVWLDIGTAEGQQHVRDTTLLHRLLLKAGWRDEVNLRLLVVSDAVHDEDAWAARLDQVLQFLYPSAGKDRSALP